MLRSDMAETKTIKRRREITAEMAGIGFCLPGSLVEQMRCCSTPGCRCHDDASLRHGPYRLWTRKVAGKTVTRTLSDQQYDRYRAWAENARRLHELVAELEHLSVVAMASELDWEVPDPPPPDRRRTRDH